ncbi:MAG TPA: BlaI/MecI/CopY family transcriptional regulator [Candidatus Bacteroides avicola]|uniref:BlaI/MecI/CopY family transcriptional regulator n=1 Tax=Candidatus Bacteroides avicola TaxID=2838468 RepID=A0A9D2KUS6_9BACE|nr:BlaI/MecI/CopY family transcriptional regulator [Candidatus Bacteroides avicola]
MKKLTAKEEEVMGFFWKKGPLYVKDILELYSDPKPHFNTVSTVVRGLEERGFVGHKAYGKTYQYYAVVSRDDYRKGTLRGVISKYFDNSYLGVVSSLVEEEKITVDELKALIRQVEEGQ